MKTIEVTILDGEGLPKAITVEVPQNATQDEIEEAVEKATHNE